MEEETSKKNKDLYTNFIAYRDELDLRNTKREKLVKMSRDVTILSKKVIFSLLRKDLSNEVLIQDADKKIQLIRLLLLKISEELINEDQYQFARAFSPGVQEFIEAVSLLHYIETKCLLSLDDASKRYFTFDTCRIILTPLDYMYGIADLTGELMRMTINSLNLGDFEKVDEIYKFMRDVYNEYSRFEKSDQLLSQKLGVMRASLQKIENALYTIKVRGFEFPDEIVQIML